ncbi:TetR/AcrR family transcriptional regulator [Sphingobium sp.]|uniref:TetR/AcrR family transcriptional regulator n=1 Tax=Sphingobium sp. TaxID=1912891 RepID=UPI002CBDEF4D|nr:TetR/AcrR family transcriptional regulator [Sphingobium sp.]HUD94359.1 TetR/AcrR family transcriptional regulator [Sphingobium sp.]
MAARDEVRLKISRESARLFLANGIADTSGDAIAAAAGVSTRTVWRHFANKENCIEPVLAVSIQRFARILDEWPLDQALEDHLRVAMPLDGEASALIADGVIAVRLVALCGKEPAIRCVWLEAYHALEVRVQDVVARRANRSSLDFDVRLCAATIVAAIRVLDEGISVAAVTEERSYTSADLVALMSDAIRTAATLPICDPIAVGIYHLWGGGSVRAKRD